MRKSIFILLIISFSIKLSAQNWAPTGAIWYYSMATINPAQHSVKTFSSAADTMINGISCKKIIETGPYTNPNSSKNHYMFSRNDSIFFYADGTFNLLYDFGAQPGDTIVLPYFHIHDNSPLKMIIDSVRTININGHNRILQNITCGDGMSIDFGPKVIEGIGATYFMFPTYDMTYDGPLRCYEDATIGKYTSPGWTMSCDTIYFSGVDELKAENKIQAFPNPTKDKVTISNISQQTQFVIYSVFGEAVKTGIIDPSGEIYLSGLRDGIYFLELKSGFTPTFIKILKS